MKPIIRNDVLEILNYCYWRSGNRPVHCTAVHNTFIRRKYHVSVETVPRMLRKLREEGIVMGVDGRFSPVSPYVPKKI